MTVQDKGDILIKVTAKKSRVTVYDCFSGLVVQSSVYYIHVPTSISCFSGLVVHSSVYLSLFLTDVSPADIAQCMASGKCERQ